MANNGAGMVGGVAGGRVKPHKGIRSPRSSIANGTSYEIESRRVEGNSPESHKRRERRAESPVTGGLARR